MEETKEEQQQVEEQFDLQAFLSDPAEIKNAVSLALQIQECVGKNWFTFHTFLKKTQEAAPSGAMKLDLCKMFGKLVIKEERDIKQFKIVVSNNDKIASLNDLIAYHQERIKLYEIQKSQLTPEPEPELDPNCFSSAILPHRE